jgi:hypothetical protein
MPLEIFNSKMRESLKLQNVALMLYVHLLIYIFSCTCTKIYTERQVQSFIDIFHVHGSVHHQ